MSDLALRPLPVRFPDTTLAVSNGRMVLRSGRPLRFIASTAVGGGIGTARAVLSLRVDRNFNCDNPPALLRREAAAHGLDRRFIGFLTALDLERAALLESDEPRLLALVTAGTSNATTPGRSPVARLQPGTINILALVDARLAPSALVAAVKVVTEAKTLALIEAGVRTPEGTVATGTSTDAVAIGHTGRGQRIEYAGPVTALGHALGALITQAVRISLDGGNVTVRQE
jgi:iron complex transport system ATP-binding protein